MRATITLFSLLSILISSPSQALEADQSRILVPAGLGETVSLEVGQKQVQGLYMPENTGRAIGGAILLHDIGMHPDWPHVIQPLRLGLPDFGWSTLSIEIPAADTPGKQGDYQAIFDAAPSYIEAGIAFLRAKGIENITLIGYGLGASLGAAYLAQDQNKGARAFVAIGMGAIKAEEARLYTPDSLAKITLPILDIYGSRDAAHITHTAAARALAAKQAGISAARAQQLAPFERSGVAQTPLTGKTGFIAYRQVALPGADHNFTANHQLLLKRIAGWLKRHAAGIQTTIPG